MLLQLKLTCAFQVDDRKSYQVKVKLTLHYYNRRGDNNTVFSLRTNHTKTCLSYLIKVYICKYYANN